MQLLEDGVLAALAALGLVTLLRVLIAALTRSRAARETDAAVLVPCRAGDAAALEQTVRALVCARRTYGGFRRIVILDRGMDAEARAVAELLCRDAADISLCGGEAAAHITQKENPT